MMGKLALKAVSLRQQVSQHQQTAHVPVAAAAPHGDGSRKGQRQQQATAVLL